MKKVLSALIVAVMLIGMLPAIAIPAFAATSGTYGELTYEVINGEINITDCNTLASGTLEIPSNIDGYSVTAIAYAAFYDCTGLTSITFPDSVTTIGEEAFTGCTGLASVSIPDSVTTIGRAAFNNCSGLTSIQVDAENSDYSSEDGVLFNKSKTNLICYPGGKKDSSYIIPNSVTSIEASAFEYCDNLISVTILDSVMSIGYAAFSDCSGLTSITIPDSVESIEQYAFRYCTNLTSINISDSVISIGMDAFDDTAYYNEESNWENEVLYLGNYLLEARRELLGSYTIKAGTKAMADYAFSRCYGLTSVIIPDSVTAIGGYAFSGCTGLTSVTIPDSVTILDVCVFGSCSGLTSVTIPGSITTISVAAFVGTELSDIWYTGTLEDRNNIYIDDKNDKLTSAVWHYNSCPKGKNHVYDNTCDSICNKCNELRNVSGHTYTNACDPECNICKATRTPAAHTGGTATCKDKAKCSVCGVSYGSLAGHKFGSYVYNNDATASKDGTKTRTCSVCKKTETITATGTKLENPFKDVKLDQYYGEPVLWAVGKKITNGMTADSFAPNNECTRGQIVTFLWRAAGSPEPTNSKNPFVDVKSDQYYYKAVLWAVEKGITTGTSANTFSPNAGCTRGQVVTFLHRAKGKPAASGSNAFADVKAGAYYYDAVRWAVKNEITNGMSATSFAPDVTCTRGQIVTFLYRAYN